MIEGTKWKTQVNGSQSGVKRRFGTGVQTRSESTRGRDEYIPACGCASGCGAATKKKA